MKKISDRFKLEQEILDCWGIVDDIDILSEHVCDGSISSDEIANILIGLKQLYALKFARCFNTFENCIHDKKQ
jgi:hypothetical protein